LSNFYCTKKQKAGKKIVITLMSFFFQEELENNPMKLLEERTEASKNEMDRMEALEELQELNKRTVKVDYDTMLSRNDKIRAKEAEKKEEEDEEFIKSVFGKEPSGAKVKRILGKFRFFNLKVETILGFYMSCH
jgi:hypothetical protein